LILVADDSPTVQRKAQGILLAAGFEVETVSNGVAAIKKLPNLQPILVIADVSMPGKDGYEVCEFVKTSADFRHVPVLLVGSDLEPYDEQRGAKVKADGIIKKPFAPDDLIAIVAKFTGLGEAPAPQSTLPDALVASALREVPPMGPGPEPSTGSEERDLAAPPTGEAFAGPPLEEMPAAPLPDISLQPPPEPALQVWPESLREPQLVAPPEEVLGASSEPLVAPTEPLPAFPLVTSEPTPEHLPETAPEPTLVSPELISETSLEAMPEPTQAVAEPTLEHIPEAAPWPPLVGPELISEPAPEVMPGPTLVTPGPIPEFMPQAAPEPALVSPELILGITPEAVPEQASVVPEPGLPFTPESVTEPVHLPAEAAAGMRPAAPVEEVSPPTEPILAEKQVEPIHPLSPPPDLVTPEADRIEAFRVPGEVAESALGSELAPAPPEPEPPPLVEEQGPQPMAATRLESFPLAEAAEGQARVAPPETEMGSAPEAGVAPPGGAAAGVPSVIDPEWVYIIVNKVVMKMAPPALPPELVEELVRVLTREITAELDAASSQVY
jgi:CheY-like chemotaxis protein